MKGSFTAWKKMTMALPWMAIGWLVLYSCKNDIETINALTNEVKLPDITAYDVESAFHDSGRLKGRIVAAEANQFERPEQPYTEFPRGMKVYLYDKDGILESYIQADYAIYYEKDDLWEVRNNVIGERLVTGEKLETDLLFWNQSEQRVYSDQFTKITNPEGVYYGEDGFEANEDLSQYELFGARGVINVEEEQLEE